MQTIPASSARPALERLLKAAAKYELTPQEVWDQRISFVLDNYSFKGKDRVKITREQVEACAVEMYGPRPMQQETDTKRCLMCGIVTCLSVIIFLMVGVWQYSQGHFISGGWMLVLGALGACFGNCKQYCFTPNDIREWNEQEKKTELQKEE